MNIYKSKTLKTDRQVMQTPPGIAEWCARQYGCNVDLAASAKNRKFHQYFSDEVGDRQDGYLGNALVNAWPKPPANVGFCNPPYANLTPWLMAAVNESHRGFTSVFLIPSFNGDKWAMAAMMASEIILIEGRINFIKESDGLPLSGNGRGSMLCIFGPGKMLTPAFSYVELKEILGK